MMAVSAEQGAILYDNAKRVLLFADAAHERFEAQAMIEEMGARVVDTAVLGAALDRLDMHLAVDAVVVDASGGELAAFEPLLDRLNDAAEAGDFPSVVVLPPEMIDAATARAWHPAVSLLCQPSRFEQMAEIGMAVADRPTMLNDVKSDGSTPRLRQISEEVSRIAAVLARMSGDDGMAPITLPRPDVTPAPRRAGDAIVDAMQVRAMIRARRLRELYFPADLFADPAWDMLLDLMAARLERRQVAVSSLCIAAAVPPTTALRWIKLLTDQGILIRIADPTDGRRVFIELADSAADGMMNYLAAAQRLATIAP